LATRPVEGVHILHHDIKPDTLAGVGDIRIFREVDVGGAELDPRISGGITVFHSRVQPSLFV
jgi:hypothetical protein